MDVKVTYKGREVSVEIPDAKLEELIAEKKRTGYERAKSGDAFWWVTGSNDIFSAHEDGLLSQSNAYKIANYYSDYAIATANARADTLMRKLRRYAAEHGGIPSAEDWQSPYSDKWCVASRMGNNPFADGWSSIRTAGVVYFLSREACEAAISEFRDDLLWYFTEYEPQLR